jgi:LuxR family maltose regulon positive regulatory protein
MLHLPAQPGQDGIVLGSAGWFAWLDEPTTRSFTFENAQGNFTARKERRQRGTQYWIAYRKAGGKLRNAYLGKAADLTQARLEHAAAALAVAPAPTNASASPDLGAAHAPRARVDRLAQEPFVEPHASSQNVRAAPAPANRSAQSNNLPSPLTSFIGREHELAELCDLIGRPDSAVRLVTLTGPGGTGKTRLGIAAARRLLFDALEQFPDGVFYVPLSAIDDFNFVAPAIAQTLGVRESGSQSLLENLYDFVRSRQMLLLLDNFEQVSSAAPLVASMLAAAPGLRVIVTSRALLQVYGEQEYPVPPLALPDPDHLPPLAELERNAAVALFVERARAANLSFALNDANASAVAAICVRLDGLPLAIELAAARSKLFTPQTMLARLDRSLAFLTGQARDLAVRQQTLRATIEWSYNLLTGAEQTLFARLAVFVGGFTLEAAEAVCSELKIEHEELRNADQRGKTLDFQFSMLNLVESLVNQSVVRQRGAPGPDGEPRFLMLLTLREYAWERLVARGEAVEIQRRHAAFFLSFAEQADSQIVGQHQRLAIARLIEELGNLRAVLEWSLQSAHTEDVEIGAQLAGTLWRFWWVQGRLGEGRTWLEAALRRCDALVETQPSIRDRPSFIRIRAQLLNGLGAMARGQADYVAARRFAEEGLTLWQAMGDKRGLAIVLNALGNMAYDQGDHATAQARYEESLALRREVGDTYGSALLLNNLGNVAYEQNDFARAKMLQLESLSLMRNLDNTRGIAYALSGLGMVEFQQGDLDTAALRCEESLGMMREIDDRRGIATLLLNLGHIARARQDYTLAHARYAESLAVRREIGDKRGVGAALNQLAFAALGEGDDPAAHAYLEESLALQVDLEQRLGIAEALEGFAGVAAQTGQPDRAAQLFGAAEALRAAIGAPMAPADRTFIAAFVAAARAQLDPPVFADGWAAGSAMSLDQAAACALGRGAAVVRHKTDVPDQALPAPAPLLPRGTSDTVTAPTTAPSANLLPTKLYIPPVRPNLVPRPRLISRLYAGLAGKLTMLAAPAGFGKTTLLSEWIANCKLQIADYRASNPNLQSTIDNLQSPHVAWVSLDAGDNDSTRFWSYLSAALDTLYAGVAATVLALLQSSQPPTAETILTLLVTAISDRPPGEDSWRQGVLILDDYHVITAPAIHQAVATLIDYLPPHLHVVLATREDPPLPFPRWRASGALTELRAADLRFTREETALFLSEVMKLPLSAADVIALDSRTEGWIAGLQMAALAMRDQSDLPGFIRAFSGSNRFVVDYLVAEVLGRLPSHLQAFVLQTAILDRMCGPLCDAVLGVDTLQRSNVPTLEPANVQTAYSQIVLEELERANLFLVPLDDKRVWYRYHHLFAEVVRARLQSGTTSANVADLHRRASAWFEQHGLVPEAVQQVLAAKDWEWAAALVERVAESMLNRGEYTTLQGWFEALPEALLLSRSRLNLFRAWTYVSTHQLDVAEQCVRLAEAAEVSHAAARQSIVGEAAVIRAAISFFRNDHPTTVELARQALKHLPTDALRLRGQATFYLGMAYSMNDLGAKSQALAEASRLSEAAGDVQTALYATFQQAAIQSSQGQVQLAAATYQQALALADSHAAQHMPVTGWVYADLGELWYELNDLDAATIHLNEAIKRGEQGKAPRLLAISLVHMVRVLQAQGHQARAFETIRRAEELVRSYDLPARYASPVAAWKVRLWLAQGNIAAAVAWAQASALSADDEPDYVYESAHIAMARVLIAQGHADQANALLERLRQAAEAGGRNADVIEILAVQALAQQVAQGGDPNRALDTLEQALILAERQGNIRKLVDEGEPIRLLIADCRLRIERRANSATSHDTQRLLVFIDSLLSAFPNFRLQIADFRLKEDKSTIYNLQSAMVEPLTPRELEVLRLLAAGRSNQAIADELVVAVGTVKRHVNSLCSKLGVPSRLAAVARARTLGLI